MTHLRLPLFLCILAGSLPVFAETFEEPPTLDASAILRPEILQSPLHTVRGPVPTYSGRNSYLIDSEFGLFEADGNTQLVQRVREIHAIARLREMSRSEQYTEALKRSAEGPVQLAKGLINQPVKTVTGVPKGLWKFMNRAGQSVKEAGQNRPPNPYEDGAAKDLIGFSKAKRQLAGDLRVDPYSSNATLQKELNGIGWAAYGGSMTLSVALAPVGGPAGAVLTGINVSTSAEQALRDSSPSDLRRQHLTALLEMKVSREKANAFLNNTAFSPTHATLLVEALGSLRGVRGRAAFLDLACSASDEIDALFFQRTAQLLAQVHAESPLAQISDFRGFPVCIAQDGSLIVALEWDYASWTANSANFVQAIKEGSFAGYKITGHRIVLTGEASPVAKEKLAALGIRLTEKALPGPLR